MKLRTVLIAIDQIKLLPPEQVCPCSEEIVSRYRTMSETPPLKVVSDGHSYWLFDGYHRLRALTEMGRNAVFVTIYKGNQQDAYRRYLREKLASKELPPRIPVFRHCLNRLQTDWVGHDANTMSRLFGRKPAFFKNLQLWQSGGRFRLGRTKHGSRTLRAY